MQKVNCEPTARCSAVPLPVPVLLWVLHSSVLASHLHSSSAASIHLSSKQNKTKQGIHIHQTPPRYRHAAHGRRLHVSESRPLRVKVTSSLEQEVHIVAQRRQRMTDLRPQGIRPQNVVKVGPAVTEMCSRTERHTNTQTHRQTDRQTDRHTDRRVDHNTPHPYRGGVTRLPFSPMQTTRERVYI